MRNAVKIGDWVYPDDLIGAPEGAVRSFVKHALAHDFDLADEVEGRHLIENVKVVVDFVLTPRPHLVAKGFPNVAIPLEVKEFSDRDNKSVRAVWQCITYAQSEFLGARPPFVLLFPPIRYFVKDGNPCEHAACLVSLMPKGNVGELHFSSRAEWEIFFGANRFFSPSRGLGGQPTVPFKRYVGSWK